MKSIITTFAVLAMVLLTGCAGQSMLVSPQGTSTAYTGKAYQKPQNVQTGTVVSVRSIELVDQPASLGQKIGGTIGAAIGLVTGKEASDSRLVQTISAGLGGMLGAEIGKQKTGRIPAQEIIITLDGQNGSKSRLLGAGKTVAIAQSNADGVYFRRGQKVMIIGQGRVAPM